MNLLNKEYFIKLQENDFTYIQLLRGLAASLVVFYHFTGFNEYHTSSIINFIFRFIEINSDILVVVSLIIYSLVVLFSYFFWVVSEVFLTKFLKKRLKV